MITTVFGVILRTLVINMMLLGNFLAGLVPAFKIMFGSLEVKAGIKEKPPELNSTDPVWDTLTKVRQVNKIVNRYNFMLQN